MKNPILKEDNPTGMPNELNSYTLRDKIASEALSGMLANRYTYDGNPESLAIHAYKLADSMLSQREIKSE
jgi:hypothetical protein